MKDSSSGAHTLCKSLQLLQIFSHRDGDLSIKFAAQTTPEATKTRIIHANTGEPFISHVANKKMTTLAVEK